MAAVSYKRTSSTAGNTAPAPEPKRQDLEEASKEVPTSKVSAGAAQYVYVVIVDSNPQYLEATSDIHGIYASIKDANNALKGIANDYGGALECDFGIKADGRAFWNCQDAGEGEFVELSIKKMKAKREGCEPERKWRDFSRDCCAESDGSPAEEEEDE